MGAEQPQRLDLSFADDPGDGRLCRLHHPPLGNNHAKTMFDRAKTNPKWFAEILSIDQTGALSPDDLVKFWRNSVTHLPYACS